MEEREEEVEEGGVKERLLVVSGDMLAETVYGKGKRGVQQILLRFKEKKVAR